MKSALRLITVLILQAVVAAPPVQAAATEPELIPREVLFGNPVKTFAGISADGTKISYLAPSEDGVLNVWVRTLGKDVRKDKGRTTFATLSGLAGARALADELIDHAVAALEPLGRRGEALRDLAERIRVRHA
jgi:hypothetical protein